MVVDRAAHTHEQLQDWLEQKYGLLIDSTAAAQILGFRSAATLTKARNRGLLDLQMFQVPNRKGLFTSPRALAAYLQATVPRYHLPTGGSDGWITMSGR
jgi:hypothetical protein